MAISCRVVLGDLTLYCDKLPVAYIPASPPVVPGDGTLAPSANLLEMQGFGASLVAQWLRVCLPMQGTRVRALVWEDPTCHGATRPVSHNC